MSLVPIDCAICCQSLGNDENGGVASTRCGHCFHMACITQALEYSKKCPTCREPVFVKDVHMIYIRFGSAGGSVSLTQENDLLRANRDQAQELMAARTALSRENDKVKVLEHNVREAQRRAATLYEEKQIVQADLQRHLSMQQARQFVGGPNENADALPPAVQEASPQVRDYVRSLRTLSRSAMSDVEQSLVRLRDLEQQNDHLRRKLAKYKGLATGGGGQGRPTVPAHVAGWVQDTSTSVIDLSDEPDTKRPRPTTVTDHHRPVGPGGGAVVMEPQLMRSSVLPPNTRYIPPPGAPKQPQVHVIS